MDKWIKTWQVISCMYLRTHSTGTGNTADAFTGIFSFNEIAIFSSRFILPSLRSLTDGKRIRSDEEGSCRQSNRRVSDCYYQIRKFLLARGTPSAPKIVTSACRNLVTLCYLATTLLRNHGLTQS